MRPQLVTKVLTTFSQRIAVKLPQFESIEPVGGLKGGLLYRWKNPHNVNCFIYLQIDDRAHQDSFMIELACSNGGYPENLIASDPHHIRSGSVRFRLPELYHAEWQIQARRVPWWWVGPEIKPEEVTSRALIRMKGGKAPLSEEDMLPIEKALPLVDSEIEDAISRIERFGIPFFASFTGI